MSALRVLSLVLFVLGMCVCGLMSCAATDPTTQCNVPVGDSNPGKWVSDIGFWQLYGFQYYSDQNYQILCAFRALYYADRNSGSMVYGPWHGNTSSGVVCQGPFNSSIFTPGTWTKGGNGNIGMRVENGKTLITMILLGWTCDTRTFICAGVCPGNSGYAALQADPTYHVYNFSVPATSAASTVAASSAAPPPGQVVVTTLNATSIYYNVSLNGQLPSWNVSVIPAVQVCTGVVEATCPA